MTSGIDFPIMFGDSTGRIHDKGLASCQFHHAQHPVQYAIVARDLLLAVRQQGERQSMLGCEFLVGVHVIHADAENHGTGLAEREDVVAELAGFGGAAGCAVLRIEVEHDPFAAIVGKAHALALLVRQGECRSGGADGRLGEREADGAVVISTAAASIVVRRRGMRRVMDKCYQRRSRWCRPGL